MCSCDFESIQGEKIDSFYLAYWVIEVSYGTVVEQRSLLNRPSACGGIQCCNICFVLAPVLSIKTESNLVKIRLFFCIMLLIQWSIIISTFCWPCCYCFWETEIYTPSVFRMYMLTYMDGEPMTICVIRNIYIHIFRISLINLIKNVYYKAKYQNYIPLPVRFY